MMAIAGIMQQQVLILLRAQCKQLLMLSLILVWIVGVTSSADLAVSAHGAQPQAGGESDGYLFLLEFPWVDLGEELGGASGTPRLMGDGSLAAGTKVQLLLDGAAPNAAAAIVLGASEANLPVLGGTLVPAADLVLPGLITNPDGALALVGTWPPAAAIMGLSLWMQGLIADTGTPAGVSLSNAVRATVP